METSGTQGIRKFAIQWGKNYAARRGMPFATTFTDHLSGDVARLAAMRAIRIVYPRARPEVIEEVIQEVLAP